MKKSREIREYFKINENETTYQNSEKESVPNSMLILKIKPFCLKYGQGPIASVSPRTCLELLIFRPLTRSTISDLAL